MTNQLGTLRTDSRPGRPLRSPSARRRPAARSSQDLATNINAEHAAAVGAAHTALEHALEVGRLLTEAKASVRHGEWVAWITENLTFDRTQASRYMKLFRDRELLPNDERAHHFSLTGALRAIRARRAGHWRACQPGDILAERSGRAKSETTGCAESKGRIRKAVRFFRSKKSIR